MKNETSTGLTAASEVAKPRKVYHTPRMENYGAVNELTRSGSQGYNIADAPSFYNSGPS